MSTDETRKVVEGYLGEHGIDWMAEGIEFFEPGSTEPHRGRGDVAAWLGSFYGGAFTDARADPGALIVDDARAAFEFTFRGVHTGSLFGEEPTGRAVSVPMVAVYDVAGGEIVTARLYYDAGGLRETLSGGVTADD